MNRETAKISARILLPLLGILAWPVSGFSQVTGAEIEEIEELPVISSSEIEELVGPIALYPDDLLAVVLPAATYPLQVVEAARFLEALEGDPSLEPDSDWDDSVVALLNYPEVLAMLNEDLDWTWRLGEAVVAQQSDVIAAIELFRDRAYAAGNLESDDYQQVSHEGGSIQITPVAEDVIHVPYYEPEEVVVYQPQRVYYYYPRPYPVYYYPYPSHYVFHHGRFWGVTTAFTIGWSLHHLNVYHHSFYGHPYYGYTYWDRWWYRRPDIHIYNNYYVRNYGPNYNRYRDGDRWYPNVRSTIRPSDQRVTRTRYYPGTGSTRDNSNPVVINRTTPVREDPQVIRFKDRPYEISDRTPSARPSTERGPTTRQPTTTRPSTNMNTRTVNTPTATSTYSPRPKAVTEREPRAKPDRSNQFTGNSQPSRDVRQAPTRPSQQRSQPSRPTQPTRAKPPSRPPQATTQPSRQPTSRSTSSRSSQSKSSNSRSSGSRTSNSRESSRKN